MPGFNQTGPLGQGPMTGRRMGRCTNFGATQKTENNSTKQNSNDNVSENYSGKGFGRGRGGKCFGMGRQNRFRGNF